MPEEHDRRRFLTAVVEDYTKTIYHLEEQLGSPVSTSVLAERLSVRPASVSGMLRKLDDLGYLDYVPYHGVKLSDAGRLAALAVVRRHRLVELFLFQVLGVPWDKVHDEAELLEHALSPSLCDLIAARLGEPEIDPHGDPIPTRDGEVAEVRHEQLAVVPCNVEVRVARVSDRDPEILRMLSAAGIAIGSVISVVSRVEGEGIIVDIGGSRHLLPAAVMAVTLVDPLPTSPPA